MLKIISKIQTPSLCFLNLFFKKINKNYTNYNILLMALNLRLLSLVQLHFPQQWYKYRNVVFGLDLLLNNTNQPYRQFVH